MLSRDEVIHFYNEFIFPKMSQILSDSDFISFKDSIMSCQTLEESIVAVNDESREEYREMVNSLAGGQS